MPHLSRLLATAWMSAMVPQALPTNCFMKYTFSGHWHRQILHNFTRPESSSYLLKSKECIDSNHIREHHLTCPCSLLWSQSSTLTTITFNTLEQRFSTGVPRNPRIPQKVTRGSAKYFKYTQLYKHFSMRRVTNWVESGWLGILFWLFNVAGLVNLAPLLLAWRSSGRRDT